MTDHQPSSGGAPVEARALAASLPVTPISHTFGFDRGTPVDRYYIERFLNRHRSDIHGRVLEVAEPQYAHQFGERVDHIEILHATGDRPGVTIVGDLSDPGTLPDAAVDCFICTQTLHVIYELQQAVRGAFRLLRPEGVLLATLPGITQISRYDMDRWGDYWRLTDASATRLFADVFGVDNVEVTTYGNVAAACAFLQGLAAEELSPEQRDRIDPDYPVLVGVRAVRKGDEPR